MSIDNQLVMRERVRTILNSTGLADKEIAARIKISPQNLSNYLNGKRTITDQFLRKLSEAINVPFGVLRYEEEYTRMYREKAKENRFPMGGVNEADPLYLVDETEVTRMPSGIEFRDLENGMVLMTISLVDEFAYASYPRGWKDAEYIEDLPKHSIVIPKRDKGLYRGFVVRGESMDDNTKKAICPGDIAIGRNIEQDLWDSKLYINGGKDYIIVHHDGIMIKRVVQHDVKAGILQCISTNPDKTTFPDFTVNLAEVYELYMIYKVERDWKN